MFDMPLHPVIVHIPLALAILLPFGIAFLFALRLMNKGSHRMWIALAVLQALLLGSAFFAAREGEEDEEVVEEAVSERLIHEHEEKAEALQWGAGITLALLGALLFVPGDMVRKGLGGAVLVGSLVNGVIAIQTGHSGGKLVYQHGASAPHVAAFQAGGGAGGAGAGEGGEGGEKTGTD